MSKTVVFLFCFFLTGILIINFSSPVFSCDYTKCGSCEEGGCDDCSWCTTSQPPNEGIYNPALPPSYQNMTGSKFIPWMISAIISLLMTVGAIAMFIYLVYGGIMWISAGGDQKRVEAAGKQITNAIIGMIILASGWAFVQIISTFLGVDILGGNLKIPKLGP